MAWYDITLEGFRVHQQTTDHAFNVDGWADEVFIHSDVRVISQSGATLVASASQSAIMGDTNSFPHRVHAGSKTPRGGLQTNDEFPYHQPWARQGSLRSSAPPMRLWQGELTDERAITITPSLWEWDGGSDLFNSWGDALVSYGPAIAQAVVNIITMLKAGVPLPGDIVKSTLELGLQPLFSLSSAVLGQAKDRPIGLSKSGKDYVYNAQTLILTDKGADLAARSDFGKGPGVIEMVYRDDGSLGAASYSLYLKVEKLSIPLQDGALLREQSNPRVYVIYGGAKFWIPSMDLLRRYTSRPEVDVVVVPDGALADTPVLPRDMLVLREWSSAPV